ncbi:MAG: SHOCT domain-containing protein [Phycisphaerales bacterium JB063]
MLLLTQTPQEAAKGIYFWLGMIVLAAVVMTVLALILRKLLLPGSDEPVNMGFTLADLREMHAKGELTDEEFDQAKRQMLARGRSMLSDEEEGGPGGESSGKPVDEIDLG